MRAKDNLPRILVTDADKLAGLGAVRSLARAGYKVMAGYPAGQKQPPGAWSRYWSSGICYPSARLQHFAFREWLLEQVNRRTIDGVLPISEAALVAVASVRQELPTDFLAMLPSDAALEYTLSKYRSTEKALSIGIPCPRTVFVSAGIPAGKWNRDLSSLSFPIIIKTDNYLAPGGTYESGRHFIVTDTYEADRILSSLERKPTRIIAQELILGNGTGAFLLRFRGKTYMRFAHRRLHEVPYTGGVSSFRESIRDDYLVSLGEALLKVIDYEGVAMVEFRRSGVDGNPYFLEINGRLWGSLALALHCGVDFPKSLVECYENGTPGVSNSGYQAGIKCRNIFTGELLHVFSILRAKRGSRSKPPSKIGTVIRFLLLSLNPRIRHDYLWWSDPGPGLVQAVSVTYGSVYKLMRKIFHRLQDCRDVNVLKQLKKEYQARSTRARYFDRPPEKILFVCYGNICRSPFAEYLWNASLPNRGKGGNIAISAGFHREEGRRTPAWAVELAAEYNVDLGQHRSRVLTRSMVESADAIFIMDRRNYRCFVAQFPWARHKVHLLGLFADNAWTEIEDPYGLPPSRARGSYEKLVLSLGGLLRRIYEEQPHASDLGLGLSRLETQHIRP